MKNGRCLVCHAHVVGQRVCELVDVVSRRRFTIVECPSCTVMRTVPVPGDLNPYYASDLGQVMKTTPSKLHTGLKRILLKTELRRIVSRVDPGVVIDVGCGTGDFIALIHQKGFPAVAVDASAARPIEIRHQPAIPYHQIEFERYEISGLRPCTGVCTVILRHVLEHVKDPRAFLHRLTEYGASYFYIVVPNSACFERRLLGRYWCMWDPPRHLWHFNEQSVRDLFQTLGLEIIHLGYETIPNLVPSFYRFLRLKGFSPRWYNLFQPKGALSSLSSPVNFLLPHNVLWVLVKVR